MRKFSMVVERVPIMFLYSFCFFMPYMLFVGQLCNKNVYIQLGGTFFLLYRLSDFKCKFKKVVFCPKLMKTLLYKLQTSKNVLLKMYRQRRNVTIQASNEKKGSKKSSIFWKTNLSIPTWRRSTVGTVAILAQGNHRFETCAQPLFRSGSNPIAITFLHFI